jgi:hypothetical protein
MFLSSNRELRPARSHIYGVLLEIGETPLSKLHHSMRPPHLYVVEPAINKTLTLQSIMYQLHERNDTSGLRLRQFWEREWGPIVLILLYLPTEIRRAFGLPFDDPPNSTDSDDKSRKGLDDRFGSEILSCIVKLV